MSRLSLITCFAICLSASAAEPGAKWLADLNLIEAPSAKAPLACVPVGATARAGEKWQASYSLGFVEAETAKGWKVWLPNFTTADVSRDDWERKDIAPDQIVRKESALDAVKRWITLLKASSHSNDDGWPMQEFSQAMVVASVLHRRGEAEAAGLLEKTAQKLAKDSHGSFQQALKADLAKGLLHSAQIALAKKDRTFPRRAIPEASTPRAVVAKRLAEIVEHFPDTPDGKEAGALLKQLQIVMDAEAEQAKTALTDEALAKLPVKEQVAYLIQRLTEQTGDQMTMPGNCDIFEDDEGENGWFVQGVQPKPRPATTSAGKLVRIGLDAVPQLLDALGDRRPTRAIGHQKASWHRSRLLDVGDCAFEILRRISGRNFFGKELSSNVETASADLKRNVEAWWEEVKSGKEADRLDQDISSGGYSHGLTERLAKIAPERLVGAIERGLTNAGRPWDGSRLIETLDRTRTSAANELLLKSVTQARFLEVRLSAAKFVRQGANETEKRFSAADQQAARDAVVKEWKTCATSTERHEVGNVGELASMMANLALADPSLFPAITAELSHYHPNTRAGLIAGLDEDYRWKDFDASSLKAEALERFLAEQLGDQSFAPAIHITRNRQTYTYGARVAEFAAHLLHRLWPARYPFQWDERAAAIEKDLVACANAWRSVQKLAPLAISREDQDNPNAVTRITLSKDSMPLDASLQGMLDAWLHKPLDGRKVVAFQVAFAKLQPEHSIRFNASRYAARAGFSVEVTVGSVLEPFSNGNSGFYVIVDGKHAMSTIGGFELRLARNAETYDYEQLSGHIAKALAGPAESTVIIQTERMIEPAALRGR